MMASVLLIDSGDQAQISRSDPKNGECSSPGNFQFIAISADGDGLFHGDPDNVRTTKLRQTTNRRMFIIDGAYMGLTHQSKQVGDKVFMLLEGDMPFVPRPLDYTSFSVEKDMSMRSWMATY